MRIGKGEIIPPPSALKDDLKGSGYAGISAKREGFRI
jgi:hypothetical protein